MEIVFTYKKGMCGKGVATLRVPVIIKQAAKKIEPLESLSSVPEEMEEDDIAMVLPLSRFKLEEKFNLLSKTANALNEMEDHEVGMNGTLRADTNRNNVNFF